MGKNALLRKALRRMQNPYLLVNLLIKRIQELKDGATLMLGGGTDLSLETVALLEIADGKIWAKDFART